MSFYKVQSIVVIRQFHKPGNLFNIYKAQKIIVEEPTLILIQPFIYNITNKFILMNIETNITNLS